MKTIQIIISFTLILFFQNLLLAKETQKRMNVYSESLFKTVMHSPREKIELTWGDDIFTKNPSIEKIEDENIVEKYPYLTGTLVDGKNSLALINGTPMKIGDNINDRSIYEIGHGYVLLEKKNSLVAIKIGKKKPHLVLSRITGEPIAKREDNQSEVTNQLGSNIILEKIKSIGEVFK